MLSILLLVVKVKSLVLLHEGAAARILFLVVNIIVKIACRVQLSLLKVQ
jgi:hypothetical protein